MFTVQLTKLDQENALTIFLLKKTLPLEEKTTEKRLENQRALDNFFVLQKFFKSNETCLTKSDIFFRLKQGKYYGGALFEIKELMNY